MHARLSCVPCTRFNGWPESCMNGVCTVVLAGKSPNIWSYRVHTYGSGQLDTFYCYRLALLVLQGLLFARCRNN